MQRILAKSEKHSANNQAESLVEHTQRALDVFQEIKKLIMFDPRDEKIIYYAILFHDFGKINLNFQRKLQGEQQENETGHNFLSPTVIDSVLNQAGIKLENDDKNLLI